MNTANELIELLGLRPHPKEGGFFRETYRAALTLPRAALGGYPADRSACTAIYYLLAPGHYSRLHRLRGDEVFHFYFGDPIEMLQLGPDGGKIITIGTDIKAGELPQVLAPGGVWQGSRLKAGGQVALIGCTVAPGFDYADYEDGEREALIKQFPQFADMIRQLT